MYQREDQVKEFEETVLQIKRVSKKTKGGNQIGFTALVVIGDKKGKIGVALGKAKNVPSAIRKAIRAAKKKAFVVPLSGTTITKTIKIKYKAARIILKPAPKGTGLVAGGAVRAIAMVAGIEDMVAKCLGSRNLASNAWGTLKALKDLSRQ